MGFYTSLSGIRAASSDLNIIGNNIANSSTTGFKGSRAEFADVYAASLLGAPGTAIGQGVRLAGSTQLFGQGNIAYTGNSLDMAINGKGFFQLSDTSGANTYTRAGNFSLDREGYVVNGEGLYLNARQADANGAITGGIGPIKLDTSYVEPKASTELAANINFDARAPETDSSWNLIGGVPDPAGYNSSTSTSVYDSLGNPHTITLYYSKTATDNQWSLRTMVDGVVQDTSTITFNDDGSWNSPANITITWDPSGGATPGQTIVMDLSNSTQYGSDFAVNSMVQDGYTTGQILGVDIDEEGMIFARFTNGQSKTVGQVVLANFANEQGLQPLGDTAWAETYASGQPVVSEPGTAGLGLIQSGALEESNVDLTEQLVQMIEAQRNFQANAQAIQTEDTVTQTIINLR